MDFQIVLDFLANSGIWAALFVWLFYNSRKEGIDRENKLMEVVTEQGKQLIKISDTLDNINHRLDKIEDSYSEKEQQA